ncbi:hypothetical protein [Kordia sp.]|uniref:hypothetical protein n=1 Tax=Kordia sp. TaxID=1965332 RepID=UPI003B5B515E
MKIDINKLQAFLFLMFGILFFGCSSEEAVIHSDSDVSSHIEYFGFTLVDTYWDDPTDTEVKTNYADEVHSFSNMADILVVHPTDNIVNRINTMQLLQMKSILHLQELFFEVNGDAAPSGTNYSLRSDYQSRWNEFVNTNNFTNDISGIQAFYLGEEPTWNGISFEELKLASDYIKSTIPEIPILLVEAAPVISDLQVPASVDWIGFDHYFVKDPKNDTTYNNELLLLKSKFSTANQKLVIVMDTHHIPFAHLDFGNIELNEMDAVAESYYELALSEPKTIAILGYFWPSGFDAAEANGARNFPNHVKNKYVAIGKTITGKE